MTLKILKKGKQGLSFCLLIVYLYLHSASCRFDVKFRLTTQHRRDIILHNIYIGLVL